jgi:transposase
VIADSQGRAIAFRIAPGQAHELPEVIPLLDSLPGVPTWVVADRGYSSSSFRERFCRKLSFYLPIMGNSR